MKPRSRCTLTEAERRCCPFLTFEIAQSAGVVKLEIATPAGGEPTLRGLVAALVAGWEDGLA